MTQKTAWFIGHRVRLAMEADESGPLSGEVEVDETIVGGKDRFKHKHLRRGPWGPQVGKVAVMGLLGRHGEGRSQVSAKVVSGRRKGAIQSVVRENVAAGSILYTDAVRSYDAGPTLSARGDRPQRGIRPRPRAHQRSGTSGACSSP